jgi:DNA-binding response OmpR family regulator
MMTTILLADDDRSLVDAIREGLEQEGYSVHLAYNGIEALRIFCKVKPDIALIDVRMPGLNGFEVCLQIRTESTIPVILISALTEEIDCVVGLEVGADCYLKKPFTLRELLARIGALERRIWLDGHSQGLCNCDHERNTS